MVAKNLTTIRFFWECSAKNSTRVDFFLVALLRWSAKSDFWGSESEKSDFFAQIRIFFSENRIFVRLAEAACWTEWLLVWIFGQPCFRIRILIWFFSEHHKGNGLPRLDFWVAEAWISNKIQHFWDNPPPCPPPARQRGLSPRTPHHGAQLHVIYGTWWYVGQNHVVKLQFQQRIREFAESDAGLGSE